MRIFKRIIVIILILAVALVAVVMIYRHQIIQYSAETLIRNALPDYIKIDKMRLDLKEGHAVISGFKILNPPGFMDKYILTIDEISCRYAAKGKNILDGIEISNPVLKRPTLYIERFKTGVINLSQMAQVLDASKSPDGAVREKGPQEPAIPSRLPGNKKLSDIVKLPESFLVKNGRFIFIDRLPRSNPHTITLENVEGFLSVRLDDSYSRVVGASSEGMGNLNGNREEIVKWTVSFNPATPKLTMSNRFEVSGLDMLPFEPYYDKYSPFVFKSGIFSGTLVFDFDNGNIGSTNEVRLSKLQFYIKRGHENASFWETTVPDLAKYFTSPFGEIVFDFKIKGDMSNPKFYLGPISKEALTSMAIDKISSAIEAAAESGKKGQGAPSEAKSDVEKAKEYIGVFMDMIKKKE